jgi:hypothetical protein
MMNRYRFAILIAALLIGGSLFGAVWRFPFGRIGCAEISTSQVKILKEDKFAFPSQYTQPGYAVVVCRLDPGRTLSIYDFSLEDSLNTYPCVALRVGTGEFDASNWKIDKTEPDTWYSLLFRIDAPRIEKGRTIDLTLEYNYSTKDNAKLRIPFHFLGSDAFTNVAKITESGMLPPRQ